MPIIRRYTSSILIFGVSVVFAFSAVAGPVLDRIQKREKLVIAHRESSVPFSYLASKSSLQPIGYALELCDKLAQALKNHLQLKKLDREFVLVTSESRMNYITDGKADLECGSTTSNVERQEKVAFTIPHYIAGARILVRANSSFTDLNDFSGKKLVSTKGSTPLKVIDAANRDRLLGIHIMDAPDHAKAVDMVEKGEADGFVMDDVLLYGLMAGRKMPSSLKVVGKYLTIEPLAIMFSKQDHELKKIIDDEMRRLIVMGEAQQIYDKWFMQAIPPTNRSLNLSMSFLLKDFWKYPTELGSN